MKVLLGLQNLLELVKCFNETPLTIRHHHKRLLKYIFLFPYVVVVFVCVNTAKAATHHNWTSATHLIIGISLLEYEKLGSIFRKRLKLRVDIYTLPCLLNVKRQHKKKFRIESNMLDFKTTDL
ncbi:hypothetical protein X777_13066 [Ooceraea biroi]|uniref:Uncharacterized protein n=1 Tax=Ooceraea biroi TaxID=2015173 RepID=A0A026X0E1_OOCBI|nr:hypothetical protein X777_13066 [Ooceraea biroi]